MRLLKTLSADGTKSSRELHGQSLVEFTIVLPVILIMLSGLIEFGFMLNYYLDIIDAARETARFAANDDPIRDDATGNPMDPNPGFYDRAQDLAKQSLDSASDGRIEWPEFAPEPFDCNDPLLPINGDVVLSAFSLLGNTVDRRYPIGTGDTGVSMCGNYNSKMTVADVNSILSGSSIPNSGFVLIEIYYEYDMVLGLPWIRAFVPDPVVLYAYSIMPNTNLEPTPTP
ncbi:MAG: TadE/TadG family type IV pilus assembly protein [Anaerolineales bacterium]